MGNTTRQKVRARRFAFSPAAMTSAWQSTYFKDLSLIMTGAVLATVPLVLLFASSGGNWCPESWPVQSRAETTEMQHTVDDRIETEGVKG